MTNYSYYDIIFPHGGEFKKIIDLGLEVKYNHELGKNIDLKQLEKQYDAIFLAFGANVTTEMGVQGEELQAVFGGNQLLEKQNHPDYTNKKVAIILLITTYTLIIYYFLFCYYELNHN